jgi:hypothetical protein
MKMKVSVGLPRYPIVFRADQFPQFIDIETYRTCGRHRFLPSSSSSSSVKVPDDALDSNRQRVAQGAGADQKYWQWSALSAFSFKNQLGSTIPSASGMRSEGFTPNVEAANWHP